MSFKKRAAIGQPKLPAGTRLSPHNAQLLTSTGVPSLDDILGGGLPIGTLLLIKQDKYTGYGNLLLKYFLAQGMVNGHHVATVTEKSEEILASLPGLATKEGDRVEDKEKEEKMSIAWRYERMKKFETSVSQSSQSQQREHLQVYCETFDLTKKLPLGEFPCEQYTQMHREDFKDHPELLERLSEMVREGGFSSLIPLPTGKERNVLRIGIQSLASPCWQPQTPHELYKFFHALRGLLRFSFASCVITFPSYLYSPSFVRRIEYMADAVIELESFAPHTSLSSPSDYHGFLYVHRLPVLNSLVPSSAKLSVLTQGGNNNLGFKLRRKKFTVETFHLPPEGGVSERRVPTEEQKGVLGKKDALDF
ncbi:uncharacterized protein VTP21DRAFT_4250 [Calcarisporiella thermophila]|uniref:uncharacterized protein n=1 Tax=Calcarisporiella thermophila TaxID=911321 RepID=UPI00374260B2